MNAPSTRPWRIGIAVAASLWLVVCAGLLVAAMLARGAA